MMKAKPLPKPLVARYRKLQAKFGAKEFTRAQVEKILSGDKAEADVIIARLKKEGRIAARDDGRDMQNELCHLILPPQTA